MNMLEAEILASKIEFHIFYFSCELANLILAIWVPLHCNNC